MIIIRDIIIKSLTDIANGVKSTFKNGKRALLVPVMALGGYIANADASPVQVTFTPDQSGTVSAPVVGLGGTNSDYLLVNPGGTVTLDKNFDGNNQEQFAFSNPSIAQDGASFDDNYMFQLGTDNNIRRVDLADGSRDTSIDIFSAGAYSFGIGYDAVSNSIGIGNFNPDTSEMTFSRYYLGTGELSTLASFNFDKNAYGTPSGLDFVDVGGNLRMLVATKDQFSFQTGDLSNYVLDMNASNGSIDQYFTTPGLGNKLQDVLYENGQIMLANQSGGSGFVQVGDFTPPHPFDFNDDGEIDAIDLGYLVDGWLAPREELYGQGNVPYGLCEEGIVNLQDFSKFAGYYLN